MVSVMTIPSLSEEPLLVAGGKKGEKGGKGR